MASRTAGLELTETASRHLISRRARPAADIGQILAAGSLLGLVAFSLLMVVMAADRPSSLEPVSAHGYFPRWLAGPLAGLWPGLTRNPTTLAWLASGGMAVMFALYLAAFSTAPRLRARWTILALLAIHVVFVLAPPMSYTDVFNYINYGRMGIVHHLNPYSSIPLLEPHSDPSFPLSNWHLLLSPYGPLFTLLTYALVPLGVTASFWALKAILAITSLAMLTLVWKCARLLGRAPASAVVFVGCNPIVLIWGLGADHNDSLMVMFLVLSTYLLLRRPERSGGAGAAIVFAAFVKASGLVLLPVLLFAGARRRFLGGALLATCALAAVSLLAFGTHLPNISGQSDLVMGIGLPNLLGLALGLGGETSAVRLLVTLTLLLVIGGCAWRVHRQPSEWVTPAAVGMLALLASLSWSAPWYVLWALPFAALSPSRRLRYVVLIYCVYLLLAFVPAAPLLEAAIHFNPDSTRLGMEHRQSVETLAR